MEIINKIYIFASQSNIYYFKRKIYKKTMAEVRFYKCTKEQYDRLMQKEEESFYVTEEESTCPEQTEVMQEAEL